jgi:hypothetical protein
MSIDLKNSLYFLSIGLRASNYNPLKFFRALFWWCEFKTKFFIRG